MGYWTVILIASIVISYQLHETAAKFSFAVPGKWGNHKRVPFTFALPGKWGEHKRSAPNYSTCDEPNIDAIMAIYDIIQSEVIRVNKCLLHEDINADAPGSNTKRSL